MYFLDFINSVYTFSLNKGILIVKRAQRAAQLIFMSCLMLTLANCQESHISLIGDDLSMWQKDPGTWFICGSAELDPGNRERISTSPGTAILVNGKDGNTKDILSRQEFGDIEAHIEFMVPEGSNSGVYFMGRYEIQILDSWGKDTVSFGDAGGVYERWDENREPKGYEGISPKVNASRKAGEWQEFNIVFQAPRFNEKGVKIANAKFVKVVFNGILIHENVEVSGPTREATFEHEAEKSSGPLMLQGDHGPVAYRNIRIKKL